MSEQEIRDMRELDELSEKAGGLVSSSFSDQVHYNYRKIAEYCKRKKIEPQDLTLRELQQFVVAL